MNLIANNNQHYIWIKYYVNERKKRFYFLLNCKVWCFNVNSEAISRGISIKNCWTFYDISSPEKIIHPRKSKFYPLKFFFIPNVLRDENFYPGINFFFPGWIIFSGDEKIFLGDENLFSGDATCFPGIKSGDIFFFSGKICTFLGMKSYGAFKIQLQSGVIFFQSILLNFW